MNKQTHRRYLVFDEQEGEELLELTRQNNEMLLYIVAYINHLMRNADNENNNDFMRNVIANMISTGIENKILTKQN